MFHGLAGKSADGRAAVAGCEAIGNGGGHAGVDVPNEGRAGPDGIKVKDREEGVMVGRDVGRGVSDEGSGRGDIPLRG